jgi:hypothetical protein
MAIWYILWLFGIFISYGVTEKNGNPGAHVGLTESEDEVNRKMEPGLYFYEANVSSVHAFHPFSDQVPILLKLYFGPKKLSDIFTTKV